MSAKSGPPTALKVGIGALIALLLVFVASEFRKGDVEQPDTLAAEPDVTETEEEQSGSGPHESDQGSRAASEPPEDGPDAPGSAVSGDSDSGELSGELGRERGPATESSAVAESAEPAGEQQSAQSTLQVAAPSPPQVNAPAKPAAPSAPQTAAPVTPKEPDAPQSAQAPQVPKAPEQTGSQTGSGALTSP